MCKNKWVIASQHKNNILQALYVRTSLQDPIIKTTWSVIFMDVMTLLRFYWLWSQSCWPFIYSSGNCCCHSSTLALTYMSSVYWLIIFSWKNYLHNCNHMDYGLYCMKPVAITCVTALFQNPSKVILGQSTVWGSPQMESFMHQEVRMGHWGFGRQLLARLMGSGNVWMASPMM